MALSVATDFDSGGSCNLTVDDSNNHIDIEIDDEGTYGASGYFHFRLDGAQDTTVSFEVTNLSDNRMPSDYHLLYTDDLANRDWWRFDGDAGGGWSQTFGADTVYISNMFAYPYNHTVDFVTDLENNHPDYVTTEIIGQSYEGRDMYVARISNPDISDDEKEDMPIVTRLHPGEVEGSWHVEAMVDHIIETLESDTTAFDTDRTYHVIPHGNPDGMYHGYHRQDTQGNNLNREFDTESPIEVANIKDYIRNNIDAPTWGFDCHTTTNESYGRAVNHYDPVTDAADEDTLRNIASHSRSLSGISGHSDTGWLQGWYGSEFGEVMALTELWAYHEYDASMLATEGEWFFKEMTTLAGGDLVTIDDAIVTLDGQFVVDRS